MEQLYFPDFPAEDFDFEQDWLVQVINSDNHTVIYQGLGKNEDLSFTVDYSNDITTFETLSPGDLISFPRETFLSSTDGAEAQDLL